jgi:hypothetical protein
MGHPPNVPVNSGPNSLAVEANVESTTAQDEMMKTMLMTLYLRGTRVGGLEGLRGGTRTTGWRAQHEMPCAMLMTLCLRRVLLRVQGFPRK